MKVRKNIHFWHFPVGLKIKFDDDFRILFFKRAVEFYGSSSRTADFLMSKRRVYGFNGNISASSIRRYKSNTKQKNINFIQWWIIFELSKKIGYNSKYIEKKIIGYRYHIGSRIKNPVLPIEITPDFDSIVAHMMCDGTDKRTRNGAASYTQYDINGRRQFFEKIKNVFGIPIPSTFSDKRMDMSVGVPTVIMKIIKHHYSIVSFGCRECRIPKEIYHKSRHHRLAFLVSFIIDEGTVYDLISIRTTNKELMQDLKEITELNGYRCSEVTNKNHKNYGIYGFNISNYSLGRLSHDIRTLNKKYGTFSLLHKQDNFDNLVRLGRHSRPKRRFNETKGIILSSLQKNTATVMELSHLTGVGRRSVRNHIEDLKTKNMVRLVGEKYSGGAKIWGLRRSQNH
jgi:hypothetical protein